MTVQERKQMMHSLQLALDVDMIRIYCLSDEELKELYEKYCG